jgi:uncharacterized low-complexity protein
MTDQPRKPVATALGTALAGGLLLSGTTFAVTPLVKGYLLGAGDAAAAHAQEGSCGAAHKAEHEGKCGEGRCGIDKLDTDGDGKVSRAEFAVAHADNPGKFGEIDANGDGFIDAAEHDAHHAAKAGAEGKCGEGKCGEGGCGGVL